MKRILTLGVLLVSIGILLAFMVSLQSVEFNDVTRFNPKALAATGFIILAAFSMGEVFKQLNLPALLGYIAAGVAFGPNLAPMLPGAPEALFGHSVIDELTLVNVLTVGLIGTLGGGELKLSDIKKNFKLIALLVIAFGLVAVPLTFTTVIILVDYAPNLIPFLADVSRENQYAAALLLGVFAMAMSPAATLAIIQEEKSRGAFTSLTLGIVIVADIVLVEEFLLAFAFDKLLIAPEGFTVAALISALPAIAAEIGYAIIIGLVTGAIFIAYLRFVGREVLLFTVAVIFAASYASKILHAETLMAFLTAGFVVQNFSKHGHDMIVSLEKISLPVFIVYFMSQAALLDLEAVLGYIELTLILTLVRAFAIYVGTNFAVRLTGAGEATRKYLWLGFFSRGGVDLVLAAMVAEGIPTWGKDFQTVIMASVVVHIILGPPLLKFALDRSGETDASRAKSSEETQALDAAIAAGDLSTSVEDVFPEPEFDDRDLTARVERLRNRLAGLYAQHVAGPISAKTSSIEESLDVLHEQQLLAVSKLREVLSKDYDDIEAHAHAVELTLVDYLIAIQPVIDTWEQVDPIALDAETAQDLIQEIQGLEPFTSSMRLTRGDRLFEPEPTDRVWRRILKSVRRVRRSVIGPGQRNIPLGRLWRYFVELSLPRYLNRASAASAVANEQLWAAIVQHMRHIDEMFTKVEAALLQDAVFEPAGEAAEHDDGHGHGHHEEPEIPADPVLRAQMTLNNFVGHCDSERGQLREKFNAWRSTSKDAYTASLRESYGAFLRAVGVAGTLELPGFTYRPSTRFDAARRAEAQMRERLAREKNIVSGQRGWMVVEHQLLSLEDWFHSFQRQVKGNIDAYIQAPCRDQLTMLGDRISTQLSATRDSKEPIDWDKWVSQALRPALRGARRNFEHTLAYYGQGAAARQFMDELETRVGRLSENAALFATDPGVVSSGQVSIIDVPVREWFESEFSREVALRFVEFNERAQVLLRNGLEGLADVQQIIEFNLLTNDAEAPEDHQLREQAIGGLERAFRLVGELCEENTEGVRELRRWFINETNQILTSASQPFFEHKLGAIRREMDRKSTAGLQAEEGSMVVRQVNQIADVITGTYDRWAPVANEVATEVRSLLVEEEELVENADIRERLLAYERGGHRAVPAIYRRLFTPIPLDIPEFYVARPEFENDVATAIGEWTAGHRSTILIHGDRGAGKRSAIHHILHGPVQGLLEFGDVSVHNVILTEDLDSGAELAEEIGGHVGADDMESIPELGRYLLSRGQKSLIVIENGEKIFQRTEAGLKAADEFLHLVSDTSENTLWVILMGSPAARWLHIAMGLFDYFTHAIEIPSLDTEQIQKMILQRHRVSGFSTRFERPQLHVREWISHPFATSEAVRDPQTEFFDDLTRLSGGNPLLALLYWLESTGLAQEDDHLVVVDSLPDNELGMVKQLSLEKRVILSTLIQHHSLTIPQMSRIIRREPERVRTELEHLNRLGFIETKIGRDASTFQLKPLAEALITRELRRINMI